MLHDGGGRTDDCFAAKHVLDVGTILEHPRRSRPQLCCEKSWGDRAPAAVSDREYALQYKSTRVLRSRASVDYVGRSEAAGSRTWSRKRSSTAPKRT